MQWKRNRGFGHSVYFEFIFTVFEYVFVNLLICVWIYCAPALLNCQSFLAVCHKQLLSSKCPVCVSQGDDSLSVITCESDTAVVSFDLCPQRPLELLLCLCDASCPPSTLREEREQWHCNGLESQTSDFRCNSGSRFSALGLQMMFGFIVVLASCGLK